MQTEIEAKFLDINPEALQERLKEIDAELIYPERLMKRKVFEHPIKKQLDWLRVRDEGDKITLSYKKLNDRTLHGTQEVSVEVNDFEKTCKILEGAQLRFASFQETKRELWKFEDSEITIDTWPWIPTFVELESPSEEKIKSLAEKLNLNWKEALHGSVETAYQKYFDVTEKEVNSWPEISFIPVPNWLERKRK
ncbi:CYTH domain-containing protein [Candidatus Wolfebacteria bacterium]|nr:CYTH domain-containing protein [Candidatus Wolfebacteria bacterium]